MPSPSRYLSRLGFLHGKGIVHCNTCTQFMCPQLSTTSRWKLERYILYFRHAKLSPGFQSWVSGYLSKYNGSKTCYILVWFGLCLVTKRPLLYWYWRGNKNWVTVGGGKLPQWGRVMRSSREVRELPSYKFPEFESASRSKKIPLSFHHCVLHHQVWTVGSSRTSHDTLENSKERGLLFICVMKSLSLEPVCPAIYLEIAPPQLWCVPPAFCSRIIGRLLRVLPH